MRHTLLGALLAVLTAIGAFSGASARPLAPGAQTARTAVVCRVLVDRGLPAPDNAWNCTPGAYVRLTRAEVCDGSNRPTLRAADRREIVSEYRVPNWSGQDGELDHRVPVFLGGRTVPENVWPEPGAIPNAKDRLEFRVYRRICFSDPAPMRVRTARRLFLADWRHAYWAWKADGIL